MIQIYLISNSLKKKRGKMVLKYKQIREQILLAIKRI